jgi:hypothetical protein
MQRGERDFCVFRKRACEVPKERRQKRQSIYIMLRGFFEERKDLESEARDPA